MAIFDCGGWNPFYCRPLTIQTRPETDYWSRSRLSFEQKKPIGRDRLTLRCGADKRLLGGFLSSHSWNRTGHGRGLAIVPSQQSQPASALSLDGSRARRMNGGLGGEKERLKLIWIFILFFYKLQHTGCLDQIRVKAKRLTVILRVELNPAEEEGISVWPWMEYFFRGIKSGLGIIKPNLAVSFQSLWLLLLLYNPNRLLRIVVVEPASQTERDAKKDQSFEQHTTEKRIQDTVTETMGKAKEIIAWIVEEKGEDK